MKTALRIAVIVALVFVLSKIVANAPGGLTPASLRKRRHGCGGSDWRSRTPGAGNMYVADGMGGEMVQTSGLAVARVGVPLVGPQGL